MSEQSRAILAQLTPEEKCALCAQADGSFGRVERLGLPGSVPQDNPRGGEDYFTSGAPQEGDGKYHPVAFPSNACLAMGWDSELAFQTGAAFGTECRANPDGVVNWLFRPGVNIKRSPLCGRNFEYFSEDPVLAGKLAGAYIRGLQQQGVAATLKHYICNNQEFERMTTDAVVSERALREIYLRAFQIAIEEGDPWSVMSSYNMVNGEWVNSNPHVCELLRRELGYEGVVVSDFAAVHRNKVAAHACGMMDVELAPTSVHSRELLQALREGRISEEAIDRGLERLFDLALRLRDTPPAPADMEALHAQARKAAEDCAVLLKNEHLLPLRPGAEAGRVLVVGALAEKTAFMGGGSGHMNGWNIPSLLDAIRGYVPEAAYAPGYGLAAGAPPVDLPDREKIAQAVEAARQADVLIFAGGQGDGYESEGYDRPDIQLPPAQRALLDALGKTGKPLVLVLACGSVLDITPWEGAASAVLYTGLGGEAVAEAAANILFGAAEPGGRLAETWPRREQDTPSYLSFAREGQCLPAVAYSEDIYVGYRWYDKRGIPPLYPFGHGLSYTTFGYGQCRLSKESIAPDETVSVTVPVANAGKRSGSTVLQLYVRRPSGVADQPVQTLAAFAKVRLEPGETREVTLTLDRRAFETFVPGADRWVVLEGQYELNVALSAASSLCRLPLQITPGETALRFTEMHAMAWFVKNPRFWEALRKYAPEAEAAFAPSDFQALILALPIYKATESFMGQPMLSPGQLRQILDDMNGDAD